MSLVQSNNEWDPLEEVIVGTLEGAANLTWEIGFEAVTAVEHLDRSRSYHLQAAGRPVSPICSATLLVQVRDIEGG